jgi:hypothetical protein
METVSIIPVLSQDKRLGPSHIILFLALLQCRKEQGGAEPFFIGMGKVIGKTTIQSKTTYYKCIRDLERYGYIEYRRSREAEGRSEVRIGKKIVELIESTSL